MLEEAYGKREWKPGPDPLSELIRTILSQNTSDVNSYRAFRRLKERFKTWEELADADEQKIEEAIREGGLFRIKSLRIKEILQAIKRERENLDLNFLKKMELEEARAWLKKLPGVGHKTAACVLLFSLGKPAFPVDTHVYRVSRRLGLVPFNSTPERTSLLLEKITPEKYVYQAHVYFIQHGRLVCKSQRPKFSDCILEQICPKIGIEV